MKPNGEQRNFLQIFCISKGSNIRSALERIDKNQKGFLIIVDKEYLVYGVLTDGDIRRAFLADRGMNDLVDDICKRDFKSLCESDKVTDAINIFKDEGIKFLPIISREGKIINVITKKQMHVILLRDEEMSLWDDFSYIDENILEHEIYSRPWGFYKTTLLNNYYQSKIIRIDPMAQLSLQVHQKREEYWIVVHGRGKAQVGDSIIELLCGSTLFIPKGCKHRVTNTSETESLIISEVQIGEYLKEDDIFRLEDAYGRV